MFISNIKKTALMFVILLGATSTVSHSVSIKKVSALLQTIIGGGSLGVSVALLQNAGSNVIIESAKNYYAQAGFGSFIGQIRVAVQQLITDMGSGNLQRTLDIEKLVYVATGVIAAALLIDGVKTLVSDSNAENA